MSLGVKTGKTRNEHMFSGLPAFCGLLQGSREV